MARFIEDLIVNTNNPIEFISDEGDVCVIKRYTGERTLPAVKRRLAEERCDMYCWVRVRIIAYMSCAGPVWVDIETGKFRGPRVLRGV